MQPIIPLQPELAQEFLEAGAATLNGRAAERDVEQERTMAQIVATFNQLYGTNLTETQGWGFMVILKLVRSQRGAFKPDDYIDLCGYAGLLSESAARAA